jgi:hypothetical protein
VCVGGRPMRFRCSFMMLGGFVMIFFHDFVPVGFAEECRLWRQDTSIVAVASAGGVFS